MKQLFLAAVLALALPACGSGGSAHQQLAQQVCQCNTRLMEQANAWSQQQTQLAAMGCDSARKYVDSYYAALGDSLRGCAAALRADTTLMRYQANPGNEDAAKAMDQVRAEMYACNEKAQQQHTQAHGRLLDQLSQLCAGAASTTNQQK